MKIEKKTEGEITLFTITNAGGASVTLSTLGAGIVSVIVPDSKGEMIDVCLGYANPADYLADGPCAGKVPGRYANRIARGKFTLDDKEYQLAINNGPNALHGGPTGFQNRIWKGKETKNGVRFTYFSADGEENYPGNLTVTATYTWSDDNRLTLHLQAETDAPTIVNLTNHAYWNLDGHNSGSVLGHTMELGASHFLPTDDTLIPTGEIAPVDNTPMDFLAPKTLGRDIKADFPSLKYGKGYDSCWVIDNYEKNGEMRLAASLAAEKSDRVLNVWTTQPAVQVYTGCWLAGCPANKEGRSYDDYDGVAIECQNMPDAPNHDNFPSPVLRPGEKFDETIEFEFTTLEK